MRGLTLCSSERASARRFFIISDLAGIRVERPEVFEHVHRLVFKLIEEGLVEGLRIDHVDGLYDPRAYCRRLRPVFRQTSKRGGGKGGSVKA